MTLNLHLRAFCHSITNWKIGYIGRRVSLWVLFSPILEACCLMDTLLPDSSKSNKFPS